jgi:hypothetical protein
MVSTEMKRTIVKSPPELWEQVSDQETLMRHLGEFGEIRITRSEPEKIVEWETDQARGKVQMKPSGWGTQVLLSVTRELPEQPPSRESQAPVTSDQATEPPTPILAEELEPAEELTERETPEPTLDAVTEAPIEASLDASEPEPQTETQAEVPVSVSEPSPDAETHAEAFLTEPRAEIQAEAPISSERPPRRGFFARLFKRRPDQDTQESIGAPESEATSSETPLPAAEKPPVVEDETQIVELQTPQDAVPAETEPVVAQGGVQERDQPADSVEEAPAEAASVATEERADLAAELARAEELLSEQTAVVLTSMLDRLGAAHHRPFSRG